MSVYYLAEIRQAAIGHFDGIPIENFDNFQQSMERAVEKCQGLPPLCIMS